MDLLELFLQKAAASHKTIVFPEGDNALILEVAALLLQHGAAQPLLLGDQAAIETAGRERGLRLDGVRIIDPLSDPLLKQFGAHYAEERSLPGRIAEKILREPLYFGAMLIRERFADGLVAGINYTTNEVILASELLIGLKPGISVASSFYIMDIPGFSGSEGSFLVFADPAVNPDPSPAELADIAVTTAESIRELLGWEPRVALLSFSTFGSACHPKTEQVMRAAELARQKAPELLIEGEMQADAALSPAVAAKKTGGKSAVAGRANILVFPDLNAANIGSKLTQQLAGATSFGPVLQGFRCPVSDLSRSAGVEDILKTALLIASRDS